MDLLWPWYLFLLALIPLVAAVYILILRRRRRFALRYSSLSLIRATLPRQSRLRRHLPFVLFLLALTSLVFALTRPVRIIAVPTNQTTILLVIDVSLSMRQDDIPPSRIEAAQDAAISFIRSQKAGTRIGIVAFSGFAEVIQPPTTDQEALEDAIGSLTLGRRTGIGSGILKAIDAIAEIDVNVAPSTNESNAASAPTPVPKGAYAPDIIVLLTDGVSNVGPLPIEAAQQAADRGLRVYTIGFGTEKGSENFPFGGPSAPQQGGRSMGGEPPQGDPQFRGGGGFRRGIDEETLKEVSALTDGEYYSAESADELQRVFKSLPTYLITKHETMEISVIFAAAGALLAAVAVGLALLWNPLP